MRRTNNEINICVLSLLSIVANMSPQAITRGGRREKELTSGHILCVFLLPQKMPLPPQPSQGPAVMPSPIVRGTLGNAIAS